MRKQIFRVVYFLKAFPEKSARQMKVNVTRLLNEVSNLNVNKQMYFYLGLSVSFDFPPSQPFQT